MSVEKDDGSRRMQMQHQNIQNYQLIEAEKDNLDDVEEIER